MTKPLSLSALLSQPGASIQSIGKTPIEERPIAKAVSAASFQKIAVSTFALIAVSAALSFSQKAQALEAFNPDAVSVPTAAPLQAPKQTMKDARLAHENYREESNNTYVRNPDNTVTRVRQIRGDSNSVRTVMPDGNFTTVRASSSSSVSANEMSSQNFPDYQPSRTGSLPTLSNGKDTESFFLDPTLGYNPFAALATRMENLVTTIYKDPAVGRNIGIGYNIDAIGTGQAWADLAKVGMRADHISILKKNDASQYHKIQITANQAADLLLLVQPRYEGIAKNWLGDAHWNKLAINQKAAVTYLAYQTGGRIEQFKNTQALIRNGDTQQAQKHLVTYYRDGNDPTGQMKKNTRFEKHVGAMWHSPQMYARNVGLNDIAKKWDSISSSNKNQFATGGRPASNYSTNQPISVVASHVDIDNNDAAGYQRPANQELAQFDALVEYIQRRPPSTGHTMDSINQHLASEGVPMPPPLKSVTYKR